MPGQLLIFEYIRQDDIICDGAGGSPERGTRGMFSTRKHCELRDSLIGLISSTAFVGALPPITDLSQNYAQAQATAADSNLSSRELTVRQKQLLEVAKEAYLWGWPLVYVRQLSVALERVPAPGVSGGLPVAPINELSMLTNTIKPGAGAIPCANQDVIYGFGLFDLEREPVVFQVPDFGDRFWLYQLGDQRTDAFAELGCMYKTAPGSYLVASEEWDQPIPEGIREVFRCSTRYCYLLPRVYFENCDADRATVMPAIREIGAYPLSSFDNSTQIFSWDKPRWFPNVGRAGRARQVAPDTFFETFSHVLKDVPPKPGEEAMYKRFEELAHEKQRDPLFAAELKNIAPSFDRDVVQPLFEFRNVGIELPGYWTTIFNGAAFGNDYKTRTAVAKSNPFVNRRNEAAYYYLDLDSAGSQLLGENRYEITFSSSTLPPADGFWSLTVYDERHVLPENIRGRITIGSRDRSVLFNPDGSLTIIVDRTATECENVPGVAQPASKNILSSPPGKFSLYLRLYQPREEAQSGRWAPPAVRRIR